MPIPGPRRLERLDENVGATRLELCGTDMTSLNEAADRLGVAGARYNEAMQSMTGLCGEWAVEVEGYRGVDWIGGAKWLVSGLLPSTEPGMIERWAEDAGKQRCRRQGRCVW